MIENPITCITAKVPISEIGIEIEVMMVVAFERRKKRLTSTTSANVIARAFQTSSSVARTKMVLSVESLIFMPSGRLRSISGILACTAFDTSSSLERDWRMMPMPTLRLPPMARTSVW